MNHDLLDTISLRQPDMPGAASARRRADFSGVDIWVFDLDNTLYPPSADLWPQIDTRISLYLMDLLGLDGLSARVLQKHWYARYGTTLKALMDEYAIDPVAFLRFCHDIDRSALPAAPALSAAIGRLPGRKLIFTNGSRGHAEATTRALGIDGHFEAVFDIADAGFAPKPTPLAYRRFVERHDVAPDRAAMFEDLEKNLLAPHALGMVTVLVATDGPDPHREDWEKRQARGQHVDFVTQDLAGFLTALPATGQNGAPETTRQAGR